MAVGSGVHRSSRRRRLHSSRKHHYILFCCEDMPTYQIRGIDVNFPFPAYDCQRVYMERVIQALQEGRNALLESPTGTGKTLCLLCATLAWHASHPENPVRIIYSSRTHSQLTQVVRELKATGYRPRITILGSREQLCVHPTVSKERGTAQNHMCRTMVKAQACSFYNNIHKFMTQNPALSTEQLDVEDLVDVGKEYYVCPYYLSRESQGQAQLMFMPYNYLIDPSIRATSAQELLHNSVIIFDEAHNLEGVCLDSASFELTATDLAASIEEVSRAIRMLMVPNHSHKQDIDADDLAKLKVLLLDLEKEFDAIQLTEHSTTSASYSNSNDRKSGPNGDSLTRSGSFIYDLFQSVHIDSSNATLVISLVEQTVDLLMEDTSLGRRKCALSTLQKMLVGIFREGFSPATLAQHYRTHIHMTRPAGNPAFGAPGKQAVRTLSWWCFNAGIAMNELSRLMPRCLLLTSGTLSPLDSFAFELQTPFPIRLENPHIIQASQVWVGVVSTGPGGGALNGSYAGRTSTSYQSELGNTIVNFARLVPDGLLVFFPSYNWLQQCLDAWGWTEFSAEEERRKAQRERLQKAKANGADESSARSRVSHEQLDARDLMTLDPSNGNISTSSASSVLNRIFAFKHVVVEPRTSAELNDTLGDYRQKLDDPQKQGAVLFAVARGKVAEGLDFSDRNGRAVIITGLPFPNVVDPRVRLKREYLDQPVMPMPLPALPVSSSTLLNANVAELPDSTGWLLPPMRPIGSFEKKDEATPLNPIEQAAKSSLVAAIPGLGGDSASTVAGPATAPARSAFAMSLDLLKAQSKDSHAVSSGKPNAASVSAAYSAAGMVPIKGSVWYQQQAWRAVNQAVGRVIRHRNDYGAIILCDDRFSNRNNSEALSSWLRPLMMNCASFGKATESLAKFFRSHSTSASINEAKPAAVVAASSDPPADQHLNEGVVTSFGTGTRRRRIFQAVEAPSSAVGSTENLTVSNQQLQADYARLSNGLKLDAVAEASNAAAVPSNPDASLFSVLSTSTGVTPVEVKPFDDASEQPAKAPVSGNSLSSLLASRLQARQAEKPIAVSTSFVQPSIVQRKPINDVKPEPVPSASATEIEPVKVAAVQTSNFLTAVREALSEAEYDVFRKAARALRTFKDSLKQPTVQSNVAEVEAVLKSLAVVFAAESRASFRKSFAEMVPSQLKALYEQIMSDPKPGFAAPISNQAPMPSTTAINAGPELVASDRKPMPTFQAKSDVGFAAVPKFSAPAVKQPSPPAAPSSANSNSKSMLQPVSASTPLSHASNSAVSTSVARSGVLQSTSAAPSSISKRASMMMSAASMDPAKPTSAAPASQFNLKAVGAGTPSPSITSATSSVPPPPTGRVGLQSAPAPVALTPVLAQLQATLPDQAARTELKTLLHSAVTIKTRFQKLQESRAAAANNDSEAAKAAVELEKSLIPECRAWSVQMLALLMRASGNAKLSDPPKFSDLVSGVGALLCAPLRRVFELVFQQQAQSKEAVGDKRKVPS